MVTNPNASIVTNPQFLLGYITYIYIHIPHNYRKIPWISLWISLWYHMGLSENRVYSQWNSHLIGIMISKTIGFRGTNLFSDTPTWSDENPILPAEQLELSSPCVAPLSTSPQWHPKASEQLLALKAPSWQGKSWAVGNGIKSWKRRERKQQALGACYSPHA